MAATPNVCPTNRVAPLRLSAARGQWDFVRECIAAGRDRRGGGPAGDSPLCACRAAMPSEASRAFLAGTMCALPLGIVRHIRHVRHLRHWAWSGLCRLFRLCRTFPGRGWHHSTAAGSTYRAPGSVLVARLRTPPGGERQQATYRASDGSGGAQGGSLPRRVASTASGALPGRTPSAERPSGAARPASASPPPGGSRPTGCTR